MTTLFRRATLASMLVVPAVALGSCGGSDGGDDTRKSGGGAKAAPKGAPTPTAAVQAYFTAKRLGKAADGCALETENYQTVHYGSVGQACLDDAGNKMPQAVWAAETKIVNIDESGDSATATIQPNAGSDAQAQMGLVRVDGGWLVDTLR
jgi:hypothetical protein